MNVEVEIYTKRLKEKQSIGNNSNIVLYKVHNNS